MLLDGQMPFPIYRKGKTPRRPQKTPSSNQKDPVGVSEKLLITCRKITNLNRGPACIVLAVFILLLFALNILFLLYITDLI